MLCENSELDNVRGFAVDVPLGGTVDFVRRPVLTSRERPVGKNGDRQCSTVERPHPAMAGRLRPGPGSSASVDLRGIGRQTGDEKRKIETSWRLCLCASFVSDVFVD